MIKSCLTYDLEIILSTNNYSINSSDDTYPDRAAQIEANPSVADEFC